MKLYRAADDDYVDTGYSFAESRETAEAYLDNAAFGGHKIFSTTIRPQDEEILDLTGYTTRRLAKKLGLSDPGAIGIEEWLPRDPNALRAIRDMGFLWVKVDESFPEGTTTWIWSGTFDDGEPELRELRSR